MQPILKQLEKELAAKGYAATSRNAKTWLHKKIRELRLSPNSLMNDRNSLKHKTFIGRMYFFFYNPKGKKTLSHYDIFPLVIPIQRNIDGFLGLNLHYVEPKIRLKILDNLHSTLNNTKMDETTRMRVSYNYINALSSLNIMKPCIKQYLTKHVESKFLHIECNEWHLAALLPFEIFKKATKTQVFSESEKQF